MVASGSLGFVGQEGNEVLQEGNHTGKEDCRADLASCVHLPLKTRAEARAAFNKWALARRH